MPCIAVGHLMRSALLVIVMTITSCSLGLKAPDCVGKSIAVQGACLVDMSDAEEAYAAKALALLGGFYDVDVHFRSSIDDIDQMYRDAFVVDEDAFTVCVSGFSVPGEIWGIPQALAHELVHLEVAERTGLLQRNEIHEYTTDIVEKSRRDHEAQGWTEEDFLRVRWASALADSLAPYEPKQGCGK